jgi:hypothetical protein
LPGGDWLEDPSYSAALRLSVSRIGRSLLPYM